MTLTVLDLFSGIGGWSLGLEATEGFRTVGFVETDPFCCRVLRKHWPEVPQYGDIHNVRAPRGAIDVYCGGFPCQDVSKAGAQWVGASQSILGDRSGLWFQYLRLITEGKPTWVLIENVEQLLTRGLEQVLWGLAQVGYDAEWNIIPAYAVGLPHQRNRLWVVAHLNEKRGERDSPFPLQGLRRREVWRSYGSRLSDFPHRPDLPEPLFRGDSDGVSSRMDRLSALGNSLIPEIPYLIGKAILEYDLPSAA